VRPGRAADHSPPSSAAVMEDYSYTSTHPLGHTVTETLYLYLIIIIIIIIILISKSASHKYKHRRRKWFLVTVLISRCKTGKEDLSRSFQHKVEYFVHVKYSK
jgi:hypothetical protein